MAQIISTQNILTQLKEYTSKVPPLGDFATRNSVTPLAQFVDHFYPSNAFENKYNKIDQITQSYSNPTLEVQIAPNLRMEDANMQVAIRSIVNKAINFTDGSDNTTLAREALRMNYITALESTLPNSGNLDPNQHVQMVLDGVNSQTIVRILASLDSIALVEGQMNSFKEKTLNEISALLSVINQVAPDLSDAVLKLINISESYFQLAGIVSELVAVARQNEQPANITNRTGAVVQNIDNIISPVKVRSDKLSAAQINDAINRITEVLVANSIVQGPLTNGQQVYSVDRDLIVEILHNYATDDDLNDLLSLSTGNSNIKNLIEMYNTVVAFTNAVPVENADYLNPDPWYQMMLITVARLNGQAVSQQTGTDLMIATANTYNAISLYTKINIESNMSSIKKCLEADIQMGTKISTLSIAATLGNTSLTNFANHFLTTGPNGVSGLHPEVVISGIRGSNAAFNPQLVNSRDITKYLGLDGTASNLMPDQKMKEEVAGAIVDIVKEYR